jgi:hypothetical protein
MLVRAGDLLDALDAAVGTGAEPDGLCPNREDHPAHLHNSPTLGEFWCTADQTQREPFRSERLRAAREGGRHAG